MLQLISLLQSTDAPRFNAFLFIYFHWEIKLEGYVINELKIITERKASNIVNNGIHWMDCQDDWRKH